MARLDEIKVGDTAVIEIYIHHLSYNDRFSNADFLFAALRPSQQLLSHVETSFCLPGLNQF